ncbi:MAG: DUF3019 domain-containing protein [Pseudomonadota bacterium]
MKGALALLTTLLIIGSPALPADTLFSVKPNKCVAMNKGQVCYQKLRFQFSAPNGNYCLISKTQSLPLKCWRATTDGQFIHPFQSTTDIEYQLVDENSQTIATTSVVVAWVYKKSRKRNRWRLF